MIDAYRKIPRGSEDGRSKALPATRTAVDAGDGSVKPLGDGRAELVINGQGCGIYASEGAAAEGLASFKRMGVAR